MKKTVIVGGGVAGLAAAIRLASAGYPVMLFEQASRLGGRTYSFRERNTGDIIDNGQHLLLSCYTQTLEYLRVIGAENLIATEPELELSFAHAQWGTSRVRVSRKIHPRAALISGLAGYSFLSFTDRMKLLKAGHKLYSLREADIARYADKTVEQMLDSLHQSECCKKCFWYPLAIAIMNESPARASAEVFLRTMKIAIFAGEGPATIVTPLRGLSEVFIGPAEKYITGKGGEIVSRKRATGLTVKDGQIGGVSFTDGSSVGGDAFIVTGQPVHVMSLLESARLTLPDHIAYVPIITCNIWFNVKADIPARTGMVDTEFHWVFRKDEGYLSLVMSGAREHASTRTEELLDLALRELRSCFPQLREATVTHYKVIKEKRATVSITPGMQSTRPDIGTSYPNLFLAGDWTQTQLPATIEGAIISGFRAADRVMNS
jgi:hydroxysqualene dehydroxylase